MTASTKELIERLRDYSRSDTDALMDEAADALEIMKSELDSAADSALRHATKYDSLVQAITDQENQPSQYGTVTLAYHNAEVSRLTAELAELRAQEPVILVKQNAAGQIYMVAGDGSSFQLIKHVGASFYARPVPASQAVPDGGQS